MKERKAEKHSSLNKIDYDINKFLKKGKHTMSKRVLSMLMALALCFSMLPAAVLAEEAAVVQDAARIDDVGIGGENAEQAQLAAEQEDTPTVFAVNDDDKPQGDGTENSAERAEMVSRHGKWRRNQYLCKADREN